jgi:hypothetical protein
VVDHCVSALQSSNTLSELSVGVVYEDPVEVGTDFQVVVKVPTNIADVRLVVVGNAEA